MRNSRAGGAGAGEIDAGGLSGCSTTGAVSGQFDKAGGWQPYAFNAMSACMGGFGRECGAAVGGSARGAERGRLDTGLAAESQGVRPSFKRNRGMIGC